jgi:hypothetical protein
MRLCAPLLGILLAAAVPAPGSAAAATYDVYYACGNNLCRIDTTGANQAQLTTDGAADPGNYLTPSLSRDGTVLAFLKEAHAYVADANAGGRREIDPGWFHHDVQLSPSGKQVSVLRRGYFPDGYWSYVYNADGTNQQFANTSQPIGGWLGDRFVAADNYGALCTWTLGDLNQLGCERIVAQDPSRYLAHPEGSPDGSKLLVTALAHSDPVDHVAIFDTATAQMVRDLGPGSYASYSPDGAQIAFERNGGVYVMPADGAAGSERLLTTGTQPAWGAKRADPVTPQPQPPAPGPVGPNSLVLAVSAPKTVSAKAGLSFTITLRTAATVRVSVARKARRVFRHVGTWKKTLASGRTKVVIRRVGGNPLRRGTYRTSVRATGFNGTVNVGSFTYRVIGGTR